jgi:hypothetical protein
MSNEEGKDGDDEKKVESLPIIITTDNRYMRGSKVVPENSSLDVELVDVKRFEGPVARVIRRGGLTLNLGDYESARVDVTIELPCYVQDIDAADELAEEWIGKRMKKASEDGRRARANRMKRRQGES